MRIFYHPPLSFLMRVTLYKRGYCLLHDSLPSMRKGGGVRGSLKGKPSASSFRRLRAWCICHDVPGECWGVTLTVPGIDLVSVDDFKRLHHNLCMWANRKTLPLVWRVELQQRGQPHLHCVLFGDSVSALRLCFKWFQLLDSLPPVFNVEKVGSCVGDLVSVSRAFLRGSSHAIDIQRLNGDYRAWRYLVAHMSKGKQAQLGWAGRNWGVCNKLLFDDLHVSGNVKFDLTDKQFFAVRRWIRRLTRIRVFRGRAFFLGDPAVVRAFVDYARQNLV